ncbi:MAG: replicative DNA helicase [Bacilli bacterium]|nr:replicative DNA helicase [Bacilli bacterium]MDD3895799.1 replicative DNA helicase [Bacilli bacterium]MDD4407741.1 replicative DNA helicase [Bacilli bacterium]
MIERKVPQNLEAEMAILGSPFLTNYAYDKVCEEVVPEMFLNTSNRRIFEAIYSLHQNKIPLDSATVKNEIEKKGSIDAIGGIEYLSEVIDSVITAANIDYYIDIVREKALRRKLIEVTNQISSNAYNEDEDTNDLIDDAEKKIFSVTKARKAGEFKTIGEVIRNTQEHLERLAKNKADITGIATGFYNFDKLTSGLHENELIIIAGRPAMGKTAFGLNLAINSAINSKKPVAIFNMEMGAEQLALRMISSVGNIEMNKLKTGKLEHNDWKKVNEAMSQLGDTDIYIEDASGITVSEIRAKCRRLAISDKGLGLVVIDYLQLIQGSSKYLGNRQQEVSEISRSLKTMAMELKIPVVALAQLSRSVELRENKRPIMSDLRESGSIEQDADIVAFLYRDDYYNKAPQERTDTSLTELIIGKHRNGSTGTIELLFEGNKSNFRNFIKSDEK